ncbi:MAG: EAL domain-containing protein [Edaphobacter sp.]|uniref:EAL domain-containing protein n=1 Tax=Edaphobacter sp. TaxID=1934404 RepID=UPI00238AEA73|nr:EAL domain-containing protein [Edaphobacter sp.]MDE1175913.1 EAL domain-containing protein [Edaphobacter sp.]
MDLRHLPGPLTDRGVSPSSAAEQTFARQLTSLLALEVSPQLLFQPIVDLHRGTIAGYEALTRLPNTEGLATDTFLLRAARHGKRLPLEHLVCNLALASRPSLPPNCFLTINVGPEYLLSDLWLQTLAATGDLSGIVVEITEETSITNYAAVREREAQVRAHGGLVAVDDAGSGYASMQHIIELRPDFIKLDRHFVHNCHNDRTRLTMIEMIGAAADRLDAWIIAEGVEVVEELDELIRIDVPLAQGYLLGRPSPTMDSLSEDVTALLNRRSLEHRSHAMEPHMSICAICPTLNDAEAALQHFPDYPAAIIVDTCRRPTRILERHPVLGLRQIDVFMRTQSSSEPRQVLHRILAREPKQRFDPVVVINPEGECTGLVEIHRLVSMILSLDEQYSL